MKFGLSKPCRECPFFARVRGWIGSHDNAIEFHEIARADQAMACHMTVNGESDDAPDNKQHQCAGQALYMNAMCKMSRNPEMAAFQKRMRGTPTDGLLFSFDGAKIVEFHHGAKP